MIFCAKFNGGSLADNARFADYGDLCDLAGLGRTKLHQLVWSPKQIIA